MNAALPRRLTLSRPARLLLLVCLVLTCSGCNVLGPIAVILKGPEKVPAQYQLINRYTAIIVDDPDNLMDNPTLEAVVASNAAYHIERNLGEDSGMKRSKQFTAGFVPRGEVANLVSQLGQQRYAEMPIDEIGRRLGADQVIYVRIGGFAVPAHIALDRPQARAYVKVIDVAKQRRLFPAAARFSSEVNGFPADAELEGKYNTSEIGIRRVIRQDLAQKLGLQVARLFYLWTKPEVGSTLPG